MHGFEKQMEKLKPTFEKVAANPYISAIRDGFIASVPIILFSSIFLLVAYLPNTWGFYWNTKVANTLLVAYNYSMGLLALFVTGTTAKSLTDYKNLNLPKTNQVNHMSVIMAAEISFIIMAVKPLKTGIDVADLGTQGLICAYIVGLIVPLIYYFFIKNNITIKMPAQVPQNISQMFKDVFPLAASVTAFWTFDSLFRLATNGENLPTEIIKVLSPLFRASDSYLGLSIIAGAMAFFWFIGVQGPSIVQPAVIAFETANTTANLELYQHGAQALHVLTVNTQDYVMNFGGTGSTLIFAYLLLLATKSKQLKALGKASFIPVSFGVNEPVLFGAPIIMNPVFFIPFILSPIVNVCLFEFFVTTLHMNSMIYTLPWTLPGPLGILLSTGFAPLSFLLVALIIVVDIFIWFPFVKVYDSQMLAEENANAGKLDIEESNQDNVDIKGDITKETNVLVLCAGGGTSGILANALNKTAEERDLPLSATARAYGQDMDLIQDMDLVILAPQMDSYERKLTKNL